MAATAVHDGPVNKVKNNRPVKQFIKSSFVIFCVAAFKNNSWWITPHALQPEPAGVSSLLLDCHRRETSKLSSNLECQRFSGLPF
jgi:hypothetical protein